MGFHYVLPVVITMIINMIVVKVGREDTGRYRCVADNGVGSQASAIISLTVLRKFQKGHYITITITAFNPFLSPSSDWLTNILHR